MLDFSSSYLWFCVIFIFSHLTSTPLLLLLFPCYVSPIFTKRNFIHINDYFTCASFLLFINYCSSSSSLSQTYLLILRCFSSNSSSANHSFVLSIRHSQSIFVLRPQILIFHSKSVALFFSKSYSLAYF